MNIHSITIEVAVPEDVAVAEHFYRGAFGMDGRVMIRASSSAATGFRGFAPSLILTQPADVDALFIKALSAGAEVLKPVAKSLWGYGGSLRAPDGTVWQIASARKTGGGEPTGTIEKLVLLLGVADVKASKRFYEEQGVKVSKSYGSKYVEFDSGPIALALYKRASLAKQVGIAETGEGSHRLVVSADGGFTDLDGFAWETCAGVA